MLRRCLPFRAPTVEVFYDGACPLCRHEIDMLRRWDRSRDTVAFSNIQEPAVVAAAAAATDGRLTIDKLMARLHCRDTATGVFVDGPPAFRALYYTLGAPSAAGQPPLLRARVAAGVAWLGGLPGLSRITDVAYDAFAKRRLRKPKCTDDSCSR
jgi:predicted DCC family thiol-disulfide oxidoreductase YuxK